MKLLSKKNLISRSRLIKYAIYICIFTIVWNIIEGVVSIFFGNEEDSVSLTFFGIDSFIEVTSASLVLWRFLTESKPDEEKAIQILEENLSKERKVTIGIGLLFLLLSLATISDSIVALIQKRKPETAIASLIISSVSLSFMGFLWLSKRYLAKMLNSSTMASEAQCSLACIKITFVVFIGSILYIIWKGGWWLDSVAAIILGILFAKEGIDMILWAKSKNFNGGCCKHCKSDDKKDDKKNNIITITVEQLTSFVKIDRLSFRKSTSSTKDNISSNQEDNQEDNQEEEEKKLDCCSKNKSSNDEFEQKEICCEGSYKYDDEIKMESIKQEDIDKIEVVKIEEKESNCACCHE